MLNAVTREIGSSIGRCELALIARPGADLSAFNGMKWVSVDALEPRGTNAPWIGGTLICPAAYPRTRKRLDARGSKIRTMVFSEPVKTEGAVMYCSLIFED